MTISDKSSAAESTNDAYQDTPDGKFLVYAQDMYNYEREAQADGRALRARDERYYDGHQFTEEEKAVYNARNQTPRVYNEVKPAVDWILGSERRARSDWNVLPRTEDDVKSALIKTRLVKYIDDINKAKWQRSKAFEDCVKTGEGWTQVSVEENEDGEPMITLDYVNWQNILVDGQSVQEDLSDCRYMWVSKIVDLETLQQWFPKHKAALALDAGEYEDLSDDIKSDHLGDDALIDPNASARRYRSGCGPESITMVRSGSMKITGGFYSSTRQAVRVWEMWYRKTEKVELLANAGGLTGRIFDSNNELHKEAIAGGARTREKVREQMYMAIYTDTTVLVNRKSIYKHNRFPFVRRLASIDKSTKTPYGLVRQIVDPQSDLNQRRNHALYLMATRQVIAEKGAVEDKEHTAAEVAKANGWIEVNAGKQFEIRDNVALAGPHVQFAEADSAYVKQISGVTSENRGMNTNAMSGIAIQSLQEQGTIITTPIIDNHILAHQIEGELVLSLCEQYISRKMQFRITNDAKEPGPKDFITINSSPETDITQTQADFVVAQKDYRQTMRQALSEQLINIAAQITNATGNPMLGIAFVEMAIELQDIPNKEQLLSKLREAANLPPADENEESKKQREEAEQAARDKQAAIEEQAQALAFAKQESAINLDNSRANQYNREGEREEANAMKSKAEAIMSYLEAAGLLAQNGALAGMVDDLMTQADGIIKANKPQSIDQPSVPMRTDLAPTQQQQAHGLTMPAQAQQQIPEQVQDGMQDEQSVVSPEEQAMLEQIMLQEQQQAAPTPT